MVITAVVCLDTCGRPSRKRLMCQNRFMASPCRTGDASILITISSDLICRMAGRLCLSNGRLFKGKGKGKGKWSQNCEEQPWKRQKKTEDKPWKKPDKPQPNSLPKNWADICRRYQSNTCKTPNCKFAHVCAIKAVTSPIQPVSTKKSPIRRDRRSLDQQVRDIPPSSPTSDYSSDLECSESPASSPAQPEPSSSHPGAIPRTPLPSEPCTASTLGTAPQQPTLPQETQPTQPAAQPRFFLDIFAGVHAPVSRAAADQGLDRSHDILLDSVFEALLKLCWSGCIGLIMGAPPCKEYSRLKMKPGGPPALRTPDYMDGVPNLTPSQLQKVGDSKEIHR